MARSSRGGTRGMLRGHVGDTLFQIQKSESGYLQLAMAYNSERAYSNTEAQAINRLSMGTVERAMNTYRDVILASFEGAADSSQAFSLFAQVNYPFVRDEVLLIPDAIEDSDVYGDYNFDYPDKGSSRIIGGTWMLGRGSLIKQWRGAVRINRNSAPYASIGCAAVGDAQTWRQFQLINSMREGDYWTFIFVCVPGTSRKGLVALVRIALTTGIDPETKLSDRPIGDFFDISGNINMIPGYDPQSRVVSFVWSPDSSQNLNIISSWDYIYKRKIKGVWRNCDCELKRVVGYAPDLGWKSPLDVWPTWL